MATGWPPSNWNRPLLQLELNEIGLERIALDLGATEKEIDKALNTAMLKMGTWLRGKSIRAIAKHMQLPIEEVLRRVKRFRLKRAIGGKGVVVWYGLDPIGAIHLGAVEHKTLRGGGGGVSAFGGRFFRGAFIAKGRNGNTQVFQRKGRARLKIKKVTVPLGDEAERIIQERVLNGPAFMDRFFIVFERELKWRQRTA